MKIMKAAVAVITAGPDRFENAWMIGPLQNFVCLDGVFDEQIDAMTQALESGQPYKFDDDAWIVNLGHVDAPRQLPNIHIANAAYSAFCFYHFLDGDVDAKTNLVTFELQNIGVPKTNLVVEWLEAFNERFEILEMAK